MARFRACRGLNKNRPADLDDWRPDRFEHAANA